MKKIIFALASVFTVSALTGCGSDPEDVALGMVKAIVNGDAEKATSYCSPEAKTRCNIKEAKSVIEDYKKQSASMMTYYDKAAEPEFKIGQKKHVDLSKMGGPVGDDILVIDVKNRPGTKDDPSDYTFRIAVSEKGALEFPRYRSWKNSSEPELRLALAKQALSERLAEEASKYKFTMTNEQLLQKFDDVLSGKEAPAGSKDDPKFFDELDIKFHDFSFYIERAMDSDEIFYKMKGVMTHPRDYLVTLMTHNDKYGLWKRHFESDAEISKAKEHLISAFRDYLQKTEPELMKKIK